MLIVLLVVAGLKVIRTGFDEYNLRNSANSLVSSADRLVIFDKMIYEPESEIRFSGLKTLLTAEDLHKTKFSSGMVISKDGTFRSGLLMSDDGLIRGVSVNTKEKYFVVQGLWGFFKYDIAN